jgi:putative flippase GtrA
LSIECHCNQGGAGTLKAAEIWNVSWPPAQKLDALTKRIVSTHVEVTKLERRALVASDEAPAPQGLSSDPARAVMAERVSAETQSRGWDTLRTFGRHQIGALVATGVDFGVMIACVEWLGVSAVAGTAAGATLGAATNFTLGRVWIFRRHSRRPADQAVRYAMVSAASAAWNALGEHVVHELAHVQYVLARALVAFAVGLIWNFPMHRYFVFR